MASKGPIVTNMLATQLTEELKHRAASLGFVLCGVTSAAAPRRLDSFLNWLEAGFAGQMSYLAERREAYSHPRHVLDGCKSILMLALPYAVSTAARDASAQPKSARVAQYALGTVDYHDVIHERLKLLQAWLRERVPTATVRGVVDTAPLLEREFAESAGLGWVGKNTLLLNRTWGSYFFLAAMLTDVELVTDAPTDKGYCGTCTACLDACPTHAFPEPYVLDATKCISYLTIEQRGSIDESLRTQLDGWVFGCDVCQEVCPWNRRVPESVEPAFAPREDLANFDPIDVLKLNDEQFRQRFRKTPLWRAKRRGLQRNAILIVGTQRNQAAREPLLQLLEDEEPIVREAAAWALRRLEPDEPG